jgi:prepilin-type N-terminal cleavage/methylation domain-containing protein
MQKKGFTLVELLATLMLLSVVSIVAVTGYKSISTRVKKQQYENKVSYIENQAANFASDTGFLSTNVDYLVSLGYVEADNNKDEVINPIDKTSMNCNIVTITQEEDIFYGHYQDTQECDIANIDMVNINLAIVETEDKKDGREIDVNEWTSENVILSVKFEKTDVDKSQVSKITWYSNVGKQEIAVDNNFNEVNKYGVSAELILNSNYRVEVEFKDGTIYQASRGVKIDKQSPLLYSADIKVSTPNNYTTEFKSVQISSTDQNGSGIAGYYIGTEETCMNNDFYESNEETYNKAFDNGTYYVCSIDKVGNVSDTATFTVERVGMELLNSDVELAFTIDGVSSTGSFPTAYDGYMGVATCKNGATAEWDNVNWGIINVNGNGNSKVKCNIDFVKKTKLSDYIIKLAKKDTTNLAYDDTSQNNLRYIGANPNNYLKLNGDITSGTNALWRVIGVMNQVETSTGDKKTLVKIMRANSIGKYAWDDGTAGGFYRDNWSVASLKTLLNSGTWYTDNIKSVDSLIESVKWYYGEIRNDTNKAIAWYTTERTTSSWTGKVALIYPSDYAYATSGGSTTSRESCLNYATNTWRSYSDCWSNDYLGILPDSSAYSWTLVANGDCNEYHQYCSIYYITANGSAYFSGGNNYSHHAQLEVHPVVYLVSDIEIISGSGTKSDPWIISV